MAINDHEAVLLMTALEAARFRHLTEHLGVTYGTTSVVDIVLRALTEAVEYNGA